MKILKLTRIALGMDKGRPEEDRILRINLNHVTYFRKTDPCSQAWGESIIYFLGATNGDNYVHVEENVTEIENQIMELSKL